MASQLDILALEPFYGGVRRAMLDTVIRCSRHRWRLLKLPPRRMERRLTGAAHWFTEQLLFHGLGRVDVLFTSEAMNLASLYQLTPALSKHPSVVYFHDNQLPDLSDHPVDQPSDLVNLETAAAATEIWFNSQYHKMTFNIRAAALVDRYPELRHRDLVSDLTAKSRLMPPPVDWGRIDDLRASPPVRRNPAAVFFETRDANVRMLNEAFALLRKRGVAFTAIAVGPADELDPAIPRRAVSELDDEGQARGMLEASIVLSARPEAASDYQVIRALMAGCRPVLPNAGVYPEILPRELHPRCLYDVTPEGLAGWLGTALDEATLPGDPWHYDEFRRAFRPYDAIPVCRQFDQRLEQLAAGENPR